MAISRKTGILVSTTVCGVLVAGAGALASAEAGTPAARPAAAPAAPPAVPPAVPGADGLKRQTRLLRDLGGVTTSVHAFAKAVLMADGKLPPSEAERYAAAVKRSLSSVKRAAAHTPATGAVLPAGDRSLPAGAVEELRAKAVQDLNDKTDAVVEAVKKRAEGENDQSVSDALQDMFSGVSNFYGSMLAGGEFPPPSLEGLPKLPTIARAERGGAGQGTGLVAHRDAEPELDQEPDLTE